MVRPIVKVEVEGRLLVRDNLLAPIPVTDLDHLIKDKMMVS